MTRPVIAIDCDDVLCLYKQSLCEWRNRKCGSHWDVTESEHFGIVYHWGVDEDEAYKIIDDYFRSGEVEQLPVIPGAVEALKLLKEQCDIYMVTSRQRWSAEMTRKWAERHFGPDTFTGFLFGNAFVKGEPGVSKAELCRKINAITLIDDQPHHLADVILNAVSWW